MKVFYDADIGGDALSGKSVSIIGYGNQGRAQALNLRDSGAGPISVGARAGGMSETRALQDGFEVVPVAEAARADIVALLTPDQTQKAVYDDFIAQNIRDGACVLFAHGFSVHFKMIAPPDGVDVVLVAPRGPGRSVRKDFLDGGGLPATIAVAQDATGGALDIAKAWAKGLGAGRSGIFLSNFEEECVADLFGEQSVLCGGMIALARAAFDTLVEAGYAPEMAYFECLYEIKRIADLIETRGLPGMRDGISTTAEFGGYETGERLVTEETRKEMRAILDDIRSGGFARRWMADWEAGGPRLDAYRKAAASSPVEAAEASARRLARFKTESDS